ncbi:uncharacterized protein LOC132756803 [Ruditapes philippinarum]|uniref:uncharacterized protein LOC132756803 n=1 Tax=Ruditapes philippinarum TaxID=129788 RepID=UPI00295AC61A|nr:uncharacterized protein LOC132756803 [Ruditapes philippinarum]
MYVSKCKFVAKMQFQIEEVSYSIGRFFDLYQNKLPVVVMVTQGFYGEIIEDTFDREQVMLINAVSRQERVVAECTWQGMQKLLSIPDDYTEKLCVIKNGIAGAESSLYNILRSNSLPLWVQFPADRVLTVCNKSINTNRVPAWKLTKRFDEVYLLANTIIDGQVCTDVTHVPLYLSKLRLSLVTGLKGQSFDRWRVYFDNLLYKCSSIEYDQHFGNPNIAEYDPSTIHFTTKMSYSEPKSYSSIISLVEGQPLKSRPHLYVPLGSDRKQDKDTKFSTKARPLPPLPEDVPTFNPKIKRDLDTTELSEKVSNMYITPTYKIQSDLNKSSYFDVPQKSSLEPLYDRREEKDEIKSAVGKAPTPGPKFGFPQSAQFTHIPTPDYPDEKRSGSAQHLSSQKTEIYPKYNNDIPRATLTPTIVSHETYPQEPPQVPTSERANRTLKYGHSKNAVMNVESLSIHDVTEYLKILNLGQYAETFRNNMIDGMILIGLTEKMLREDFGMNGVEAFRLLKFAREGYIPT